MIEQEKILVVDDDSAMLETCARIFKRKGYEVKAVASGGEALTVLERDDGYHVVLADLLMPGMSGIELLQKIKESYSDTQVVIMTGHGTIENAVDAMKLGAADYITKPFDREELITTVERLWEIRRLRQEVLDLSLEVHGKYQFENIIGQSEEMKRVFEKIVGACRSTSTVLVAGESGTGKELVARAIHYNGPRGNKPFVPINCAALPPDLIESELFGHKKGSFTGAMSDTVGLFRAAQGGTIFLDEITEMSPSTQAKLLRTLQERVIRPIGSSEEIPVDVRIISATNANPLKAIETGKLREDLYYRLSVITIEMPPLRERPDDILPLCQHIIKKFNQSSERKIKGIGKETLELFMAYAWPGNVRELENVIESIFALGKSDTITKEDLPLKILKEAPREAANKKEPAPSPLADEDHLSSLKEVEREAILKALSASDGNKSKAAEILGISRKTLYKKLEEFNIPVIPKNN